MKIVHTIEDARRPVAEARKRGETVGLVPTMGYFHEGHLSLMRRAKKDNGFVVVSLFVNPTQFGPNEDLQDYPRDMDRDARMAEEIGVDLIFNPSAEEMYPEGYQTYVMVEEMTKGLCGEFRSVHFRGVATVCLKLFNIVQPDRAYFGRKDYQQLKVVTRMVKDLDLPMEIVGMPTVREPDGLAMSSRNTYLSPHERKAALVLSKSLARAQELLDSGITSGAEIQRELEVFIGPASGGLARVEYVSVVHPETLECLDVIEDEAVVALAVRIGKTRLIDNGVIRNA